MKKGFNTTVTVENSTSLRIHGSIRLTENFIKKFGYNISGFTKKRTSLLNWDQYTIVNNTINKVLDEFKASAKVTSLHGEFTIRKGLVSMQSENWDDLRWRNVGSIVNPVYWCEHNANENDYHIDDFESFTGE